MPIGGGFGGLLQMGGARGGGGGGGGDDDDASLLEQLLMGGGEGIMGALGGPLGLGLMGLGGIGKLLGGLGGKSDLEEEAQLTERLKRQFLDEQSKQGAADFFLKLQDSENENKLRSANLPGIEQLLNSRMNLAFADPFMGGRPAINQLSGLLTPFLGQFQGGGVPTLQGNGQIGGFQQRPPVDLLPSAEAIRAIIGNAPQVNLTNAGLDFGVIDRLREFGNSKGGAHTGEFAPFTASKRVDSGQAHSNLDRIKDELNAKYNSPSGPTAAPSMPKSPIMPRLGEGGSTVFSNPSGMMGGGMRWPYPASMYR